MTTVEERSPESIPVDEADLATFGYRQQLHRRLGPYSSFAAGFSFVSILTTVTEFFGFGFGFGGPAFFWTWPLVFAGQFLVALCFAELASHYPIAGCVYQWSRRLGGDLVGWFAGWMMLLGQIVSVAAAAIVLQATLPTVWSGFQLVGTSTAITSSSGATNAVILGGLLIAITTLINVIGVEIMAVINNVGVTCEIVGVVALVGLLFAHAKRGPAVVTHTNGVAGHGSYLWPFLVSTLMACYVMYGFDSAGELSEETRDPRRTAPRSILRALEISGLGGILLLLAALMAAGRLTDPNLASGGLPFLITDRLGTTMGKVILVDVSVAVCVCTLAIQTAGSRMLFSLARDGVLPGSGLLSRISRRRGTPVLPAVVVGGLAVVVLLVNVGQPQLFAALGSLAVVIVYLAYLGVTAPLLVRRLRGWPSRDATADGSRFSLGRAGLAVNLLAVGWGTFICINTAWPRSAVYDPGPTHHWYLHYFSLLFIAVAVVVGGTGYAIAKRNV
ncbi:MAG TPA: amino acid permease [Acidimicrobiales bacterium]|jgi:urea carboxylase system permease|nr:amino acid permease [Acidimicrobiales bacterium]